MERSGEDDHVELMRFERQRVEVGLHRGERHRVVAARAETVRVVVEAIDGHDAIAERRQPVRQPGAAGAKLEDPHRAEPDGRNRVLLQMRIALSPDPPLGGLRVIAGRGRSVAVPFANGTILRGEGRRRPLARCREKSPQVSTLLERRAARGTEHSLVVVARRALP